MKLRYSRCAVAIALATGMTVGLSGLQAKDWYMGWITCHRLLHSPPVTVEGEKPKKLPCIYLFSYMAEELTISSTLIRSNVKLSKSNDKLIDLT